jgi:dipeptidyl aminopeptidase/acylaminoacyl peptidase
MALRMDSQWYVSEGGAAPRELHPTAREYDLDFRHVVRISPDRTRVVLDITPEDLPAEWDRYEAPTFRSLLADARENPFSGRGRAVRQLVLVDLRSGMTRTLWSAPSMALATRVAWSPDGREVVLAPTSLPLTDADPRGVQGRAAAVMNVETGAYELLPVSLDDREAPAVLRFVGDDTIELSDRAGGTVRHHRFERQAEGWRAIDVSSARREGGSRGRDLKFRIEEALDRPARLLAQSPNGSSRALLAPNRELPKKYALGRAERIEGTLSSGQKWVGLLFYPPSYDPSKRYPLVIQSVYSTPITNEFTLYGHQGGFGSGPTMVASYPGRILAAREILVLHLNTIAAPFNTPDEAPVRQQVFEAAVETLDRRRLIDPSRVGLAGFSRNGYYVQYALTHSSFPFAAALTADNWDPSYIQQTLTGAISLSARVIGALPFESGLQAWIEHSPGFNVHRVRAPLLMIEQSTGGVPGVIGKWELFSRLRHLRKPVELFVAPDFEHGAHNTQNPRQIAAVQQRSVDWFDFWLNGREDPSAKKATQYARWRELRALRDRPLEVAPAGQAGARQH